MRCTNLVKVVVIPAKAGIQVVSLKLRSMFTTWIPACAGMISIPVEYLSTKNKTISV